MLIFLKTARVSLIWKEGGGPFEKLKTWKSSRISTSISQIDLGIIFIVFLSLDYSKSVIKSIKSSLLRSNEFALKILSLIRQFTLVGSHPNFNLNPSSSGSVCLGHTYLLFKYK